MKIADRKPMLDVTQLRALPEFGKRNARQQRFLLLIAAGATPIEAVRGAYNCESRRSGERFLHGLMTRRSMQPVLNRLYGLKGDDRAEFLKRVDKLVRRGSRATDAEIRALFLYGIANGFIDGNFSEDSQ
jgi:hypothetical protein